MTLWLNSGTISSSAISTDDEDAITIHEEFVDDEIPRVVVTVPAGVGIVIHADWFLSEFSDCDPTISVLAEHSGTMELRDTQWNEPHMMFVPDDEFKVAFQTDAKGIGGIFEFAGQPV